MGDGFAAIGSVIDDDPKPGLVQSILAGQFCCGEEKVAEQIGLFLGGGSEPGNEGLGNDKGVEGGLRIDIPDGNAEIILKQDFGGYFPGDNFFE